MRVYPFSIAVYIFQSANMNESMSDGFRLRLKLSIYEVEIK